MALSPLKQTYKLFVFEPLHLKKFGQLAFAVEDLSINQSFNTSYNPQAAYGRMDPIVTYQNTKRSMSVSFTCQAHHLIDTGCGVIDNIRRVNVLTQCLYPSYTDSYWGGPDAVLKAPPFFRIYYGNYIGGFLPDGEIGANEGLTGYITGLRHNIGKVARNVAFGGEGGAPGRALPRKIDIGFSFEVVHDKQVGWTERDGRDYFSDETLGGYGDNFPYNVGKSIQYSGAKSLRQRVREAAETTVNEGQEAQKNAPNPTTPVGKVQARSAENAVKRPHRKLASEPPGKTYTYED